MNKAQFLEELRLRLSQLSSEDADKAIEYYSEMIDDRIEDGTPEQEAVADVGSVEAVAEQILLEMPLVKLAKSSMRPKRSLRAWEIVLLILGSPIWFPLLLAALIIILSVYIVIWSAMLVLYAADLSIAVGALGGVAGAVILAVMRFPAQALLFAGAGLICAGIAILLFLLFNRLTAGIIALSRMILRGIKTSIIKRSDTI